jgi:hypothetical protein
VEIEWSGGEGGDEVVDQLSDRRLHLAHAAGTEHLVDHAALEFVARRIACHYHFGGRQTRVLVHLVDLVGECVTHRIHQELARKDRRIGHDFAQVFVPRDHVHSGDSVEVGRALLAHRVIRIERAGHGLGRRHRQALLHVIHANRLHLIREPMPRGPVYCRM